MNTFECGCKTNGTIIEYCSKHQAAGDMYEALKEITELAPRDKLRLPYAIQVVKIADEALAKAKPKED